MSNQSLSEIKPWSEGESDVEIPPRTTVSLLSLDGGVTNWEESSDSLGSDKKVIAGKVPQ